MMMMMSFFLFLACSFVYSQKEYAVVIVPEDVSKITTTSTCMDDTCLPVEKVHPVDDFEPTEEWKTILPNQSIPPGLHVRMNLQTGLKEAKFLAEEDRKGIQPTKKNEDEMNQEVNNGEEEKVVSKEKREMPIENIYASLAALPEPPTIHDMPLSAAYAQLSPQEFREEIIRLWKERQVILKKAIDSMQDSATHLQKMITELISDDVSVVRQVVLLEELEWEVADLDKAKDFNTLGGLAVVVRLVNAKDPMVRAYAAWVIGTAVKNYDEAQSWALEYGTLPALLQGLAEFEPQGDKSPVFEFQNKALYALGALLRNYPQGQEAFLVQEGPSSLLPYLQSTSTNTWLVGKVVALVTDLVDERRVDAQGEALHASMSLAFSSPTWCNVLPQVFLKHSNTEARSKVLESLRALSPHCLWENDEEKKFVVDAVRELQLTLEE